MRIPILIFSVIVLVSCSNNKLNEIYNDLQNKNIEPVGIFISYPKGNTIFPPEIPPPLFQWKDTFSIKSTYKLFISDSENRVLLLKEVNDCKWRPDSAGWESIKIQSGNKPVIITILGKNKNLFRKQYSSGQVSFSISSDSVKASIFYRAVPLPFSYAVKNVHEIKWYLGKISGGKPHKVLDNMPVCANCHSFSQDGRELAMDVDYANDKGSYIITRIEDTTDLVFEKIITWNDYKRNDGDITFGLLSQISPNGRYVLSTVKDRSVFVPVDNLEYSQLFFPIKGIIAMYDRKLKKFSELKGADDQTMVQSNPSWSPDEKDIIFARASRYYSHKIEGSTSILLNPSDATDFISRKRAFKFNLYRLPFNKGKGGVAKPIEDASDNGKSNYFARYSPNGKWIVFCQAENFMLLQPDSKLYIMPAKGGVPRLMNCNTGNMNSWHSWSPDGKWLIFSSKEKGAYTQLYITHIDDDGNDSPAVFLENLIFDDRAINIPEFVETKKFVMMDGFSQSALYFTRLAKLDLADNRYLSALNNLDKAISTDSVYFDAYLEKIRIHSILGEGRAKAFNSLKIKAFEIIEKELKKDQNNDINLLNRANLRFLNDDNEGALKDALKAIRVNPDNYDAYNMAVSIYRKNDDWNKIFHICEKMLKLRPYNKQTLDYLAIYYQKKGDYNQAFKLFNQLFNRYPDETGFYISRAILYTLKKDLTSAIADYNKAIALNPEDVETYKARANYYRKCKQNDLERKDLEKVAEILKQQYEMNPENVKLLISRAKILRKLGNSNEVIAEYTKLLESCPLNYVALSYKAYFEYSQNNWKKSIDLCSQLISNYPDAKDLYYNRALAYASLGNNHLALADLNKALILNPTDYKYLYSRAKLKQNMSDAEGAKDDFNKVRQILSEKKKYNKLDEKAEKMLLEAER